MKRQSMSLVKEEQYDNDDYAANFYRRGHAFGKPSAGKARKTQRTAKKYLIPIASEFFAFLRVLASPAVEIETQTLLTKQY
jgi:hypothetical protein